MPKVSQSLKVGCACAAIVGILLFLAIWVIPTLMINP
jgi:hypothetical protein